MGPQRILVVGAGIAGSAVAAFLGDDGHDVTVVEQAGQPRTSGSPVDIRGDALGAVAALGLTDAVRAADTGVRSVAFLSREGHVDARARTRSPASTDVEISRSSLCDLLRDRAEAGATIRFGDRPLSISGGDGTVSAVFESGDRGEFDLVIGADGQHSSVRKMLWDPTHAHAEPVGLSIATTRTPSIADPGTDTVRIHNGPGRSVALHPNGGNPVAAFIFRDATRPPNAGARLARLHEMYRGGGWRTAEFLRYVDATDDLYYDQVVRVRTRQWSRGRVVLLGDAAASLTIVGEGSSMALIGATRLASALRGARHIDDALAWYERVHRPAVERIHRRAHWGVGLLVPKTRFGISARDLLVRVARRV